MTTTRVYQDERGNALFLILIAVVLFAALSYAITQSNRGGGNVGRETNQIAGTTLTQYTSGIRTGITRMLLRGSSVDEIKFDAPSAAGYNTDTDNQVFHPDGGGVGYQEPDPNVVDTVIAVSGARPNRNWFFAKNKVVKDIGSTTGDVVALLTDVKKGICERLNEQIRGTIDIPNIAETMSDLAVDPGADIDGTDIDGQPFGCIEASDGYVYYHVLAEQ